jgi:Aminoglycoside-2''-adenylyltransferase
LPDVDVTRAEHQLQLIADVGATCQAIGAQIWLRGGWATDFFLGRVTRDHVDIDWFAWAVDAAAIISALRGRGYYTVPRPPPEQQVDLAKENEEVSFAWLAVNDAGRVVVAGGPWAGEPWPDGMLDWPTGRIGRLESAIVNPEVQVEIKEMMPVWVPGRSRRPKDLLDVAILRQALADQHGRTNVEAEE